MSHQASDKDHARQRFGRFERVRSRERFLHIQERGRRLHTRHFVFIVLPNDGAGSRLGITVTRRVARTAVVRNRIRRVVRECFRLNRELAPRDTDLVVVARSSAASLGYADVVAEFRQAAPALSKCFPRTDSNRG